MTGWFPATAVVELSLLGSFRLRVNGAPLAVKSRKGCAILAYLALSGTGEEARERLSGLLWSDTAEAKARASLRQVLHGLLADLSAAGLPILTLDRKGITLATGLLTLDAAVLEEDLRFGTISPKLVAPPVPQFLCSDLHGLDPAFDAWLTVQRELLHRRLSGRLESLMGAPATSRKAAEALLSLDPTHEAATRALMLGFAHDGDVAAALRVYKELWDLLERDYDSEPSMETKDLVVAIKTERLDVRTLAPEPLRALGAPPSPSVGAPTLVFVSTFDTAGVTPALAYAGDGLRHEIVASLVRFREWTVVDGAGENVGASAADHRARVYSLDGTVRQSGSRLFVTLTVKERPAGRYVWSEAFEFMPERWFELRASLVSRISVALNVHLSSKRRTPDVRSDLSPVTYDLWLRGHQLLSSWRIADRQRASQLLRRVLVEAPDFAPAYGSIVRLLNSEHIVRPGVRRDPGRALEALKYARVGVRLDPLNSRTHLGLGWSLAMNGRHEDAVGCFRDAIDLNGHDTWTVTSAAQGLSFCGGHEEAVRFADRALEIDSSPTRPCWAYQVGIRFLAGQFDRSVAAAGRASSVISNLPGWTAAALAHLRRGDEAATELARFVGMIGSNWQAEEPASLSAVASWFLDSFPIKEAGDKALLRDGFEAARSSMPDVVGGEHPIDRG